MLHATFSDLVTCQRDLDRWRPVYNEVRPHEALGLAVPASRYRPSDRAYPELLPDLEYPAGDLVRKVQAKGEVSLLGRRVVLPKAFRGYPVGFRPTGDGRFDVYFATVHIALVDLTHHTERCIPCLRTHGSHLSGLNRGKGAGVGPLSAQPRRYGYPATHRRFGARADGP